MGFSALYSNTTGDYNLAIGTGALAGNTTASGNTAIGIYALASNTTGNDNLASGGGALYANTTGSANTAIGHNVMGANTTGYGNSAFGVAALASNESGTLNTALGLGALSGNTIGLRNTAAGWSALGRNTTGSDNTALGNLAGDNVTTGSDNIHIGAQGIAGDSNTIRIGTSGLQTGAFIAGIYGVTTGGADAVPVLIDSNGQLGTVSSSRRFKDDIADMDEASAALMKLRPGDVPLQDRPESGGAHAPIRADRRGSGRGLSGPGCAFGRRAGRDGDVPVPAADAAERVPEAAAHDRGAGGGDVEADYPHRGAGTGSPKHQTARIDALEQQTSEIAALKQQLAQMAQLQRQVARLPQVFRAANGNTYIGCTGGRYGCARRFSLHVVALAEGRQFSNGGWPRGAPRSCWLYLRESAGLVVAMSGFRWAASSAFACAQCGKNGGKGDEWRVKWPRSHEKWRSSILATSTISKNDGPERGRFSFDPHAPGVAGSPR